MSRSERSRQERRLEDPQVQQTGVERWNLEDPVARHGRSRRASSQRQAAAHLHIEGKVLERPVRSNHVPATLKASQLE
jgi:hypothetical protein